MFPLLRKGSVQFLSKTKCPASIGKKNIYETPCPQRHLSISQHYCLLFKDHSLLQTLSRKPTSRPHPRFKILMCCLQAKYHFVTYNKLCSNFTGPLLVALQKAIMYSMKRNGPGRYFNKFLFRFQYITFFYILTYEHVGKIQKKEQKTKHIYIADLHTITY